MAKPEDFSIFEISDNLDLIIQLPSFTDRGDFLAKAPKLVTETFPEPPSDQGKQILVIAFTSDPIKNRRSPGDVEAQLQRMPHNLNLITLSNKYIEHHTRLAPETDPHEQALHTVAHELIELKRVSEKSGQFGIDNRTEAEKVRDEDLINSEAASQMRLVLGSRYRYEVKSGTLRK